MYSYENIDRITDGPSLVKWFIDVYPESASMALDVCLAHEIDEDCGIIGRCPIAHYLDDPQWRQYLSLGVIEHWGKAGAEKIMEYCRKPSDPNYPNVTLRHLHGWRTIAALRPDWIPAWSQEWETYYCTLYANERNSHGSG